MSSRRLKAIALLLIAGVVLLAPRSACAQENYFVTYTHHMEEPGNLEFATKSVTGFPGAGNAFWGNAVEMEYGVKTWWTSELYLDSQTTANESSVFTGFRFENRFRPLLQEHWINPVLYAEFEDINSADKALLEVVGHDGIEDFLGRNDRSEKKREVELKLILSSNFKGWNVAENMIAEKNIAGEPWEFGYAVAVSRPLSLAASPKACRFCRENFAAGRGALRRIGRPLQLWPARYIALSGANAGVSPAQRADVQRFACGRAEQQQPWLPAALWRRV